jgi:hypothetical protein
MGLKEQLRNDRLSRSVYAHELAEEFALQDKVKRALRTADIVSAIPWYRRAVFTPVHAFALAGATAALVFAFTLLPGLNSGQKQIAAKQGLIPVDFTYFAPDAKTVELAGDFAEWQSGKIKLEQAGNGNWRLKLSLPPGRYQYQFVVDGVWTIDPRCPARVNDDFGKENSLLIL